MKNLVIPQVLRTKQVALSLGLLLISISSVHVQADSSCNDHFDKASSLSKKASFHLNKGYQLRDKVTRDFSGDEKKYVDESHSAYKLYDYEMAVYNFSEATKQFKKADTEFNVVAVREDCSQELKAKSTAKMKSIRAYIDDSIERSGYFDCQYKIDKSIKHLRRGKLLRSDKEYMQAQQLAEEARYLLVNNTTDNFKCSKYQKELGQSIYQDAWNLITSTNKPLEQQFYCQNQLNSIALKLKDADIADTNAENNVAKKYRFSARNQIQKLLKTKACSKDSTKWLEGKFAEVKKY